MKKTIVVLAVLAAAYIGASWWMGRSVEQQHAQWMQRGADLWGDYVDVETTYERGLFSATSTSVVRVKPGWADAQRDAFDDLTLKLNEDIRHGPFPGLRLAAATIHATFEVDGSGEALQAFREAMADVDGPEADSVIGLDGTVTGTVVVPAGQFGDLAADDFHASWDTLSYDYEVSSDGRKISGSATWPDYTSTTTDINGEDGTEAIRVQLSDLTGNFEALLDGQWLLAPGKTNIRISSIDVQESKTPDGAFEPLATLDDLQWQSENSRQGETLDGSFDITTGLRTANVTVPQLHWQGRIQRLDQQFVQMAQDELLRALREGAHAQPPADEKIDAMVQRLLGASPEYNEQIAIQLENGDPVQFSWGVSIDELPEQMAALAAAMPWQVTVLQRLSVHGDLRLPHAALKTMTDLVDDPDLDAESLQQMVQAYVEQGLLREEDGAYVIDVAYKQGELSINGEPININQWLQMFM